MSNLTDMDGYCQSRHLHTGWQIRQSHFCPPRGTARVFWATAEPQGDRAALDKVLSAKHLGRGRSLIGMSLPVRLPPPAGQVPSCPPAVPHFARLRPGPDATCGSGTLFVPWCRRGRLHAPGGEAHVGLPVGAVVSSFAGGHTSAGCFFYLSSALCLLGIVDGLQLEREALGGAGSVREPLAQAV